jgi:hypothetical protein
MQNEASVATTAASQIVHDGVLGSLVILLGILLIYLWRDARTQQVENAKQVSALQEQRITDAFAARDKMLANGEKTTQALIDATNTFEMQREAIVDLKNTLLLAVEEIRKQRIR